MKYSTSTGMALKNLDKKESGGDEGSTEGFPRLGEMLS